MHDDDRFNESQIRVIASLPKYEDMTRRQPDISEAKQILDATHYGMFWLKQRILEIAAALKRNPKIGYALCIEGPPGIGKTTMGETIARCLGRPFQKINFGSLVAGWELVGGNKSWTNADVGLITKSIIRAGTFKFVLLLDELDKTPKTTYNHVTPENTLLQILDDNNRSFQDFFLDGITFDLSNILFIATCNNSESISPILLDRMELIRIPAYSDNEKHVILSEYIIPELYKKFNIKRDEFKLDDSAISAIVGLGEGESGVRSIRKGAESVFLRASYELEVTKQKQIGFMGHDVYKITNLHNAGNKEFDFKYGVGVVNTLVRRKSGVDCISIEVAISDGAGKWVTTGIYPDENDYQYMEPGKRNVQDTDIAITALIQAGCISSDYFMYKDVHMHFGNISENTSVKGVSVPIAMALYSAITNSTLPGDSLVLGDTDVHGDLLPLKRWPLYIEQARRCRAKRVFMPTSIQKRVEGFPIFQSSRLDLMIEQAIVAGSDNRCKSRPIGFVHQEQPDFMPKTGVALPM